MLRVEGAEAGETGIHCPQLGPAPGDLVNADIACGVPAAREKGGVAASFRLELRCDVALIAKVPDLVPRADRQPSRARLIRNTHRAHERTEMGIQGAPLLPHDD